MQKGLAVVLFLALCVGLFFMARNDQTVSAPGMLASNPDSLDAVSKQKAAEASVLATQAQAIRDYSNKQTAAAADYSNRQTESAIAVIIQASQAAESTATAAAFQATLEAGRARGTQEAQATGTAQANMQAGAIATQTVDAIKIAALAGQATKVAHEAESQAQWETMKLEAAKQTAWFWANWPMWLFAVLGLGAVVFGYRLLKIKESTAFGTVPTDANGNASVVIINGRIHNPNQMIGQTIDPRAPVPALPAGGPLRVAELRQGVQAVAAMGKNGYRKDAYQAAQALTQSINGRLLPEETPGEAGEQTEPAAWDLSGWSGKSLPLGVGLDNSGIEWKPEKTPNLLIAGTSGGGKSQMFTRPLIAEALGAGMQVVAMSEKMVDFAIFGNHPNLHRVKGKARGLLEVLEGVSTEIDRRVEVMEQNANGTAYDYIDNAADLIGPRIMIVVDGLVNFIFSEPDKGVRAQIWAQAIAVASLCRATGVMLVLGTTDPSHRLGDNWLAIRENCGRVATRLMEEDASRIVLQMTGAEKLRGSQFIARLEGEPVKGVAFWPKDAEIAAFLRSRPAPALPAPAWLAARETPLKVEVGDVFKPDAAQRDNLNERIRQLSRDGMSINAIQQQVFGKVGGSYYYTVKTALDGSNTSNNNTPTVTNGPVAAD